jgi:ATP-dependent DNA helicase RecG
MELTSSVGSLPFVGHVYLKKLGKLDIYTIEDLLHHVPSRYIDYSKVTKIKDLKKDDLVTIQATVTSMKNIYTKRGKKIQIAKVEDDTGKTSAMWFNQPFLVRSIKSGEKYSFSGKVGFLNGGMGLMSPDWEGVFEKKDTIHTGRLVPVYPETAGVSSKWLRSRISHVIDNYDHVLKEFLPKSILKKYDLEGFPEAVKGVHYPKTATLAEESKKRLAFNELLFIHLRNLYRKSDWNKNQAIHKLKVDKKVFQSFLETLPFTLTKSQERSIKEVFSDLVSDIPMNRLLEGDVGSGKTVVAAAAAFASFVNGLQSIIMAPTQILAEQHYQTLNEIFKTFKVRVSLVTSAGVKADVGKTDIFVGTHALIHKRVDFDNVAFIAIDEQHRFGVEQRAHLVKKSQNRSTSPHVLTMTATPIPRTVALTYYGDLDLSVLEELPKGRKPITTWVVPPSKREGAYDWIDKEVKRKGVQAFIICPLIEESSKETMTQVKAATKEYEDIKKKLSNLKVGLLHGRLKVKEKNEILDSFKKSETDVLVSTPVVEVGIDVPNATIMVIEGAERFGLAQLHQLRGRVGRGKEKSYCILFTEVRSKKVQTRLSALQKTMSGFELAELDLKLRGPGEIFGRKQHGFPELKIASWQDASLIKDTKIFAQDVIKKPSKYKKLSNILKLQDIIPN